MSNQAEIELRHKKDLLEKYSRGFGEIWKKMIDEGPELGNPLDLFYPALALTEKSIKGILAD